MHIHFDPEGFQPPRSGLLLLQGLVGFLFFLFVVRFWYLQIHRGEEYARLAQDNRLRQERIYASRGLIRDRQGALLAENRPAFGLALIREDCRDIPATLAQVSQWTATPVEKLTAKFNQDRQRVKPFLPPASASFSSGLKTERTLRFMRNPLYPTTLPIMNTKGVKPFRHCRSCAG